MDSYNEILNDIGEPSENTIEFICNTIDSNNNKTNIEAISTYINKNENNYLKKIEEKTGSNSMSMFLFIKDLIQNIFNTITTGVRNIYIVIKNALLNAVHNVKNFLSYGKSNVDSDQVSSIKFGSISLPVSLVWGAFASGFIIVSFKIIKWYKNDSDVFSQKNDTFFSKFTTNDTNKSSDFGGNIKNKFLQMYKEMKDFENEQGKEGPKPVSMKAHLTMLKGITQVVHFIVQVIIKIIMAVLYVWFLIYEACINMAS